MGLDSAAFDDERYLSGLLERTRLDGLLGAHAALVGEIQTLDGDMQMLVYDNYERFIAATDTIRDMRSNVEGMEGQMERLLQGMERVEGASESVNERLSVHRQEVERLHGVGTLLQKIRVVQELPAKLRRCLQHDALTLAARWYLDAKPVLDRYGSSSFAKVAAEVEDVVAKVRTRLQEALAADTLDAGDAAEYMDVLQSLGQQSTALRSDYVENRSSKLRACLDRAAQRKRDLMVALAAGTDEGGANGSEDEGAIGLADFVVATNTDLLSELAATASSLRSLFPDDTDSLVAAVQAPADDYVALLESILPPAEGAPSWRAAEITVAFETLVTDFARIGAAVPEAVLSERALTLARDALMGATVAARRDACAAVARGCRGVAEALTGGETAGLAPARNEMRACVTAAAEAAVVRMRALITAADAAPALTEGWLPALHAAMQRELAALVDAARDSLAGGSGAEGSGPGDDEALDRGSNAPAGALLIGWSVLGALAETVVPSLMDAISTCAANPEVNAGGRPPFVSGELLRGIAAARTEVLRAYAESRGRVLSGMVRSAMASPDCTEEPSAPRLYAEMIAKELASIAAEAGAMLPSSGGDDNRERASTVDRLFREKTRIFGAVEACCDSVVAAVAGIALRSLRECVREQTFDDAGFRQMQLDVAALREALAGKHSDELDEVLKSAEERAVQDDSGIEA